jgi:hypothetical protein
MHPPWASEGLYIRLSFGSWKASTLVCSCVFVRSTNPVKISSWYSSLGIWGAASICKQQAAASMAAMECL